MILSRAACKILPPLLAMCQIRQNAHCGVSGPEYARECRPKKKAAGGPCGEDACCILSLPDQRLLLAVADGVGGWRRKGVDPSLFSNGLIDCLAAEFSSVRLLDAAAVKRGVKRAFWRLVDMHSSGKSSVAGSSTACVAVIDCSDQSRPTMQVINVGDSGLMVVRDGQAVVFRTPSQQSAFNAPLQLTITPAGCIVDPIERGSQHTVRLAPDDVVIMGSDGLFDNVFEDEIVANVAVCKGNARKIARQLVSSAHHNSQKTDIATPFSVEAERNGRFHAGGKPDDITVLVCIV